MDETTERTLCTGGSTRLFVCAAAFLLLALVPTAPRADSVPAGPFESLANPEAGPYRVDGSGFVTSSGHPWRPNHVRTHPIDVSISIDPYLGESVLEFHSGEADAREVDRYFVRRGRIYQVETQEVEATPAADSLRSNEGAESTATEVSLTEIDPDDFGDLSPATVAALHPAVVANALNERRAQARLLEGGNLVFAWNDELWDVALDPNSGALQRLERRIFNDILGDGVEEIRYEGNVAGGTVPCEAVVTARGRELARVSFVNVERGIAMDMPRGERGRDRSRVLDPSDIRLTRIGHHLYSLDLTSMNTRVTVAEFADHLFVIEGVYNSRNCDLIAQHLRDLLGKPVRYFSFSHLHGQYVGGARSWIHEGASIVTPSTTVPLLESMMSSSHALRPDALQREPRPLTTRIVETEDHFEDGTNELYVYNVESDHTDEYYLFYFPHDKLLLTGDLLFFREGRPLTGRSKKLCETIDALGLDVERCYATWPLDGYGTKNTIEGDELRRACEDSP